MHATDSSTIMPTVPMTVRTVKASTVGASTAPIIGRSAICIGISTIIILEPGTITIVGGANSTVRSKTLDLAATGRLTFPEDDWTLK